MRFQSLASSSAGNAYVLDDGDSRLLLECGIPFQRLQEGLGFRASQLCGCLITHEHKDHSKCYADLLKSGVRVCASAGTAESLDCGLIDTLPKDRGGYTAFQIGGFRVQPFPVFHDAKEPVGYLVQSEMDGERLVFATDTVNLRYHFPNVNILAVECNYSSEILFRCTRIPDKVRHRITNSHMEISCLCGWISNLDLSSCRELYLLHLSDACANEGLFVDLVERCVPKHVRVSACPK